MVMPSSSPTFYTPATVATRPSLECDPRSAIVTSPPPRPSRTYTSPTPSGRERPREARPPAVAQPGKEGSRAATPAEDKPGDIKWVSHAGPQDASDDETAALATRGASLDDSTDSSSRLQRNTRQRTDSAPAAGLSHRRARSHFSIPDVVVTSCEEEGEEVHFEVKMEPARRKTSLPTQLLMTHVDLNSALDSQPGVEAEAVKGSKTKTKPPPIQVPVGASHTVSTVGETVASPTEKSGKRTRKTSFPLIFSKREREAAHAAAALPSSPTMSTRQGDASPSTVFTASPPQSPTTPNNATVSSFSSFHVASPVSPRSPSSSTAPPVPSSPTSIRSFSKKEIKAKVKEEKNLIKELEKIDKMVRKHDEKTQKAAKKVQDKARTEKTAGEEAAMAAKEGKTKRALKRMSVFRPSASANKVRPTPADQTPVLQDMRARNGLPPLEGLKGRTPARAGAEKESAGMGGAEKDSEESDRGQAAWNANDWSDVPSPLEERFPSLTSASPVKVQRELDGRPGRGETPLKRSSSTAQRALAKMEAERGLRRRSSNKAATATAVAAATGASPPISSSGEATPASEDAASRRRSFLGHSYKIGMDFIEGAELGWEDALESPVREVSAIATPLSAIRDGQATPTAREYTGAAGSANKRSTLLESLYKDIDDMESSFQREYSIRATSRTGNRASTTAAKRESRWIDLDMPPPVRAPVPVPAPAPIPAPSPTPVAVSESRPRGRASEESWSSGGKASVKSTKSSLSSSTSPSPSPSSPTRPQRKSRVGHNPAGFQFPPPPNSGTPSSPPRLQQRDRAGTLPLANRQASDNDEWMEASLVRKSTSSPHFI